MKEKESFRQFRARMSAQQDEPNQHPQQEAPASSSAARWKCPTPMRLCTARGLGCG